MFVFLIQTLVFLIVYWMEGIFALFPFLRIFFGKYCIWRMAAFVEMLVFYCPRVGNTFASIVYDGILLTKFFFYSTRFKKQAAVF